MPLVAPRAKLATYQVQRFDGGLNLRDAPTELASNETPDCMNVTLDERGGVESRLGLLELNAASPMGINQTPLYLYYSAVADALLALITNVGDMYLMGSTDGGATWTGVWGWSGSEEAQGAIIDFKDRVVVVNTLDGIYSFPSTLAAPTHTVAGTANMEEVRGSAIAVWQNKLWVTGDVREDATHSRTRVWFSNAGDELLWSIASNYVDIRDVDTKPCTAIGAGAGMDVTGRPTLLVFKETSMYRINDSTSGSYTTLHSKGAGAAGAKAVAANLGRICSINREGIWVTDGVSVPVRVSDKLQPLFSDDGIDYGHFDTWAAAPYRDRICFNIVRRGGSAPDLMLEYHPELGWIVPHDLSLGPMVPYTKDTSILLGFDAGTSSAFYNIFTGGTDDGTAIEASYQLPWTPLADGDEARLRQLRAYGRGTIQAELREDFAYIGENYELVFGQGSGFVWGVDLWDVGLWGDPAIEGNADSALDQVCQHYSLVFSATTSASSNRSPLLGDGDSPEVGAWAVYNVKLDYIQLGT